MNIGERLREARERKNLSQVQVCSRTGINNKNLSRYENGGSEPDLETIKRLAELYEVSANWLMGIETDEDKNKDLLKRNRIGDKLKKARLKTGLSEKEFADRVGANLSKVLDWEENKSIPTLTQLKNIAILSNTTIDDILLDGHPLTNNNIPLPPEIQMSLRELTNDIANIKDIRNIKRLIHVMKSMVHAFNEESE